MSSVTFTYQDAPSIIYSNETSTGFYLLTVAVDGLRTYRITRDIEDISSLYYDIQLDTTGITQGDIIVFKIPYVSSKFVEESIPEHITINTNFTSNEVFSGMTFKLFYVTTDNEIPAFIDFTATYTVNTKDIKFIYYRVVGNIPIYTGIFGNKSYQSQFVNLPTDTSQLYSSIIDSNIHYYFFKVTATPNVVISNSVSSIDYVTDEYNDNEYNYTLIAERTTLFGNRCKVNWVVKKSTIVQILATDVEISLEGTANIEQVQIDTINGYNKIIINVDNDPIDFRLFIK